MKKILLHAICVFVISALIFLLIPVCINKFSPQYKDSVGNKSYDEKIQGLNLLKQSAKRRDNVIIYGSSELRTDYISTHPANFFANKRAGFQVNLVGRGSCQSIIHAMSIAASGSSLSGIPVVLITSPQSYVDDGITPDMFFANFSKQQYLTIMYDGLVPKDIKTRISKRVCEMFERYDNSFGKLSGYDDIRALAKAGASGSAAGKAAAAVMSPFFLFEKYLQDNKDAVKSAKLLASCPGTEIKTAEKIDYELQAAEAVKVASAETDNNEFGMRNADYKKNVGTKLSRFRNRDEDLSYVNSVEYDDLRLLLDICKLKSIRPLFVSVPLNGKWSDYTGFSKQKRQSYYEKVKSTVSEYDIEFLDLSKNEYDEYFLCDTMHLGWKGWLRVDEEIDRFYHSFNR